MLRYGLMLLIVVGAACKKDEDQRSATASAAATASDCRPTEVTGAIRWVEDDWKAAQACAAGKKPLVIDLWAPWCHTCLSMQEYVFPDPSFAPLADRFAWLSADTDKEVNAELVAKYPPAAWPTFYVLDGQGAVLGRFVGAASVEQFRDFLVESEKAFLGGAEAKPGTALGELVAAERLVNEANRLSTADPARAEKLAEAELRFARALELAPEDWSRRPDVLVAASGVIAKKADRKPCVEYVLAHMDESGNAASATDLIATGRGCAEEVEMEAPELVKTFRERAIARLEAQVADATAPLSADDRSEALVHLRELYDDTGRPQDAKATAEKQRALLDEAAAKAPTPLAAMTYNWPRAEVYAYLARPLDLLPALEKSAADLPTEYDPPYRIAWIYWQAGKLDEALPHARKAAELAYGPRKARAMWQVAEILKAKGDRAGELAARREVVAIYERLEPGHARPADVEDARAALAELEAAAATP